MNNPYISRKYLKYRIKYFNLIINNQLGGARFQSIPNSGSIAGERMGLQCIWISIKDYLRYHRGIERSVRDLKQSVGLGPETDYTEFNEDVPGMAEALENLCIQLDIKLNFIYTNSKGEIAPYCLDSNGNMLPFRIINSNSTNIVYIATFGRHFELIINGPNYELTKYHTSRAPVVTPQQYTPKVVLCGEYIEIKEQTEINKHKIRLVEISQNIEYFKKEIENLTGYISEQTKIREQLNSSSDLDQEEKESFTQTYNNNISDAQAQVNKLNSKLNELIEERDIVNATINSLEPTVCKIDKLQTEKENLININLSKKLPKEQIEYNLNTPPDLSNESPESCEGSRCIISNKYYNIA